MRPVNFQNPVYSEQGNHVFGVMIHHYDTQGTIAFFAMSAAGAPMEESFHIPDDPKTLRQIATILEQQADYMEKFSVVKNL